MGAYILSQFKSRILRTLSVVLGIAIGTGLFLTLTAFGDGYKEAASLPLQGVASDLIISKPLGQNEAGAKPKSSGIRMPFGIKTMTQQDVDVMVQTDGVSGASAVLQVWDFSPKGNKNVMGISTAPVDVGPGNALQTGIVEGRTFKPGERQVVVVDQHYAAFFTLHPGMYLEIAGQRFEIVGVVSQSNANQSSAANLFMPIEDLQKLAGLEPGTYNQAYIRVADAGSVEAVSQSLGAKLGNINAISEDSLVQVMGGIGEVSARFSKVAAAIGLIGGLLLAWFAMSGMINERQKEIAIMRAVGWSKQNVVRVFLTEALLLSVMGAVLGILLGWGGAMALQQMPMPDFASALTQNVGVDQGAAGAAAKEEAKLPVQLSGLPILVALLLAVTAGDTLPTVS